MSFYLEEEVKVPFDFDYEALAKKVIDFLNRDLLYFQGI